MSLINTSIPVEINTCTCGRVHIVTDPYPCPKCSIWGDKLDLNDRNFKKIIELLKYYFILFDLNDLIGNANVKEWADFLDKEKVPLENINKLLIRSTLNIFKAYQLAKDFK